MHLQRQEWHSPSASTRSTLWCSMRRSTKSNTYALRCRSNRYPILGWGPNSSVPPTSPFYGEPFARAFSFYSQDRPVHWTVCRVALNWNRSLHDNLSCRRHFSIVRSHTGRSHSTHNADLFQGPLGDRRMMCPTHGYQNHAGSMYVQHQRPIPQPTLPQSLVIHPKQGIVARLHRVNTMYQPLVEARRCNGSVHLGQRRSYPGRVRACSGRERSVGRSGRRPGRSPASTRTCPVWK